MSFPWQTHSATAISTTRQAVWDTHRGHRDFWDTRSLALGSHPQGFWDTHKDLWYTGAAAYPQGPLAYPQWAVESPQGLLDAQGGVWYPQPLG